MSVPTPAFLVHPIIREGVQAAFEEREGWQTKIAAAVRHLPLDGAAVGADGGSTAVLRESAAAHVQAAIEHLAQALVLNQALMGALSAQFDQAPESHEKHCQEIGAAIETPPELEMQDSLDDVLPILRQAQERYTE